jgi:exosortase J
MGASNEERVVRLCSQSGFVQKFTAVAAHAKNQRNASERMALWSCLGLLSVGGFVGVSPEFSKLWQIWTRDPLRSIGVLILFTSIVLIIRVWLHHGWELRGTYWGLLFVTLAFVPVLFSERLVLFWSVKDVSINFLTSAFPIYLYASGVILLFAGTRVWRRAWFPLALLVLLQPVPQAVVDFCDLPLQEFSAVIARWFAHLISLHPANDNLLRLMFAPEFGMFIAPGCDGMRGAITLAYVALIVGYLKRVSVTRWILYVAGSFVLGHIFNLLRLCALVLYYKMAMGFPWLERNAGEADYSIGGLLFLVAAFLFLWAVNRKEGQRTAADGATTGERRFDESRATYWRAAAFAVLVLAAVVPGVRASKSCLESLDPSGLQREPSSQILKERIPSHVGDFKLTRTWQEQSDGGPVLEVASFEDSRSEEIEIGIWLPPTNHSIQRSLMTHGESPKRQVVRAFTTAGGKTVHFSTALYVDGATDILVGDTACSPSSCRTPYHDSPGIHLVLEKVMDRATRGNRWVPIFFKAQTSRPGLTLDATFQSLSLEVQRFLSDLDCSELSQRFQ